MVITMVRFVINGEILTALEKFEIVKQLVYLLPEYLKIYTTCRKVHIAEVDFIFVLQGES
jgi:hypothetical protein